MKLRLDTYDFCSNPLGFGALTEIIQALSRLQWESPLFNTNKKESTP
jgi:hypothetical protein